MREKRAFIILMLIMTIISTMGIVRAADIELSSPTEGATMSSSSGFKFSVTTSEVIASCRLVVDNVAMKEMTYNGDIHGRVFTMTAPIEDGAHSWLVECDTPREVLRSATRKVTVQNPVKSNVKVTSSGMFRGSLRHEVTVRSSSTPVIVDKLAPGDILAVTVELPPSKPVKELYVRSIPTKNGTQELWVEDFKTAKPEHIVLGAVKTIQAGNAKFDIEFTQVMNGKAAVTVSPHRTAGATTSNDESDTTAEETAEETPAEAPVEPQNAAADASANEPSPTEELRAENILPPATPEPAPAASPPAPKKSMMKRLLSWFSNVFG